MRTKSIWFWLLQTSNKLVWLRYKDLSNGHQVSNLCLDFIFSLPDILSWLLQFLF
jgi:hypothetical protein